MIRHARHATTEQLARLGAGALSRRKAARISAHLTGCDQCSQVGRQLDEVPAILASAQYPPIPASVSIRVEAALRGGATHRLAAMPATEGGRGNLPARHRRQAGRRGWQLPGLSVPATRLVAAAGALVIVAAGGYEIASQSRGGVPASSSAGSAAGAPAQVQQMSAGPYVTYGRAGALHTVQSIQSSANFVPAKLTTQVVDAVHAAEARGTSASHSPVSTPGASRVQASNTAGSAAPNTGIADRLAGCIDLIAPGRVVALVDLARYEGKPATIIVIAALATSPAEAWVVGNGCSASSKDLLGHAVLSHL